jgi:hypothetical protein
MWSKVVSRLACLHSFTMKGKSIGIIKERSLSCLIYIVIVIHNSSIYSKNTTLITWSEPVTAASIVSLFPTSMLYKYALFCGQNKNLYNYTVIKLFTKI